MPNSIRPALPLAILLVLLASPVSAGKIFKWVDSKGVTHYSQSPPSAVEAEELNVRSRPEAETAAAREQLQQRMDNLDRQREDRRAKRDGTTEELSRQREVEQFCQKARSRISEYDSGRQLAVRREDGSYQRLTPEDIDARRSKLQGQIDANCGN